MAETGRLWSAYEDLRAGRISRRAFLRQAVALGVAAPVALGLLRLSAAAAQDATPEAAPLAPLRRAAPRGKRGAPVAS